MPHRRCIEPGCGRLFDREATGTWRCPACQQLADGRARARRARAATRRPGTTAQGYGSVYRKRRDQIVAQALARGEPCSICGLVTSRRGERISVAHHLDSDAATGDPATVRLGPAHASCNSGFRPSRRVS